MGSWKVWVKLAGESTFGTNSCRYATKEEADAAANELDGRWLVSKTMESRPDDGEPNYIFDFVAYRPRPI